MKPRVLLLVLAKVHYSFQTYPAPESADAGDTTCAGDARSASPIARTGNLRTDIGEPIPHGIPAREEDQNPLAAGRR